MSTDTSTNTSGDRADVEMNAEKPALDRASGDRPVVKGMDLRLQLQDARIPLGKMFSGGSDEEIEEGENSDDKSGSSQKKSGFPRLHLPAIASAFKMGKIGKLDLHQLLAQAYTGQVDIWLPISKTRLEAGPLKVDLTGGHDAVFHVDVEEDIINRETTRGSIEPEVDLPLGAGLTGLKLTDDGDIKARISGLPDVNLSRWVNSVPTIPKSYHEALSLIFDRPRKDKKDKPKLSFDFDRIDVDARNVRPRAVAPLKLGDHIQLMLEEGTRLDIHYTRPQTSIRGTAVFSGGKLTGNGFEARRITGRVTVAIHILRSETDDGETKLDFDVKATNLDLHVAHLSVETPNGTELKSTGIQVKDGLIDLDTRREKGRLRIVLNEIDARIDRGQLHVGLGDDELLVELDPMHLAGRIDTGTPLTLNLKLSDIGFSLEALDLTVAGVMLVARRLALQGEAHVVGNADSGYEITGPLHGSLKVSGSAVKQGKLAFLATGGSRAELTLKKLETGPGELSAMEASGLADLELGRCIVPLGSTQLTLLPRSRGVVKLDRLGLSGPGSWPRLEGMARLEAFTNGFAVGPADVPPGRAHLRTQLHMDSLGNLKLEDTEIQVIDRDDTETEIKPLEEATTSATGEASTIGENTSASDQTEPGSAQGSTTDAS